ncbi:MAG: diguanylate cyclase [Gammaproteobacteria bacterium]|nr:diguanylate cyclase [Gammaproteobacteria bacterium]
MRLKSQAAIALFLGALLAPAGASDDDEQLQRHLAERLAVARELNTTAPWRESQSVLDEIEANLPAASPEQRAEFLLLSARNQALSDRMEAALETLEPLFDQPLTTEQRVRAHGLAANVAMLVRRWEDTFEHLMRALNLAGELEGEARRHSPMGLATYLYTMLGETGQAIAYGQRAVEVARRYGTARDECLSQSRLAYAYKIAESFQAARTNYRQSLEACRRSGDELITGVVESGLADLLRASGLHEASEALFGMALERLQEQEYGYGLAEAQYYRARLHHAQDEPEQTRGMLEAALPKLLQEDVWDYVAEAHGMLSDIALDDGDMGRALDHKREQLSARERFLDVERARQLAYLEVIFNTRSQEQELALLREQRRVAALERETRRHRDRVRWLTGAFGAFLILVLVLVLAHVLRERRHFQRLSRRDSLTGLSNHTRFFDGARGMVEQAHEQGKPLVLALGDIDHFKRVNDRHGHMAGDEALRQVARVLRDAFPGIANVGRIGGEEFAVCLPGQTAESATESLATVRESIGNIRYGERGAPLTMSFGLAEAQPGEPLESLRRRADGALYVAKDSGRNKIRVADPR